MAHKHRFKEAKLGREAGGFAALPHCVLRSVGITKLSAHASKLLLDLLAQWRGDNNGTLCCAWVVMQTRGWRSRETLDRARRELVASDFLMVTRPGGNHRPTLYALTFYRLDVCKGRHDTPPTLTPPSTWFKHEPTHPISTTAVSIAKRPKADGKIKIQHDRRVVRPIIDTTGGPINPLSPANDTTGVSVEPISMNESTRPAGSILDIPSTRAHAAAPLASPASPPLPSRVLNRQGTPATDASFRVFEYRLGGRGPWLVLLSTLPSDTADALREQLEARHGNVAEVRAKP